MLWDREVSGFGLRVLTSGARTWLLKYRTIGGAQRWHRIGAFPAMTADEARKLARRLRSAVDQGRDPTTERKENAASARAARAAAVEQMAEAYAKALPGRASLRGSGAISAPHAAAEAAAVARAIDRMKLAGRAVAEVKAADLTGFLRAEAAHPANARLLFGAFSRFMDWCRDQGALAVNPCDTIPRNKRPKPPAPRSRVIALPDLARLWVAAEVLPPVYRDLARLLLVVPVRCGEGARMNWADVDLAAGAWTLPGAITKNGDPHMIALPPAILTMLRARQKAAARAEGVAAGPPHEGLVFAAPQSGGPVVRWTWMKTELGTAAGFIAWTWHDFRRSFASIMAENGIPEPVADAVLNHRQSSTRGGVLGVYQQARRWPEQKAAMEAWGKALAAAVAAAKASTRRTVSGVPVPPPVRPRRKAGA